MGLFAPKMCLAEASSTPIFRSRQLAGRDLMGKLSNSYVRRNLRSRTNPEIGSIHSAA